jgi:glutathione S-transferase
MSDDLVFYTNPMSRGRIVRWMLEELGVEYQVKVVAYDAMQSPDYLAVNPMGKVPAIRHGEAIVTECPAICAYLADAFPDAKLAPPVGDKARGDYYRWLFFAAGPIEQAVTNRAAGFVVPPERERMFGYGNYDRVMSTLDQKLSATPYVTGNTFSAADVYLGSHVGWGLMYGTVEKRPSFEAYFDRLKSRPAYVRANEKDDALVPKP